MAGYSLLSRLNVMLSSKGKLFMTYKPKAATLCLLYHPTLILCPALITLPDIFLGYLFIAWVPPVYCDLLENHRPIYLTTLLLMAGIQEILNKYLFNEYSVVLYKSQILATAKFNTWLLPKIFIFLTFQFPTTTYPQY